MAFLRFYCNLSTRISQPFIFKQAETRWKHVTEIPRRLKLRAKSGNLGQAHGHSTHNDYLLCNFYQWTRFAHKLQKPVDPVLAKMWKRDFFR